jgi:hypothetical protein
MAIMTAKETSRPGGAMVARNSKTRKRPAALKASAVLKAPAVRLKKGLL